MQIWKNGTMGFAAGALGGLVHALVFWVVNRYGVAADIGVNFVVPQHLADIKDLVFHQIVWGGIFGLLLMLPFWKNAWFKRGLLLSLVPSLIMLLYVFPYVTGGGIFGINHGNFTFVVVLILNAIYGLITTGWASFVGGK